MHILFLCVANSARSQMAEGLARSLFGPTYTIQSAGSQPAFVHPLAIQALAEVGIDASGQTSKAVSTLDLNPVDLMVTLCADEVCPIVPGRTRRLHWPLPDPAAAPEAERLDSFRRVREMLKGRLELLKVVLETQHFLNPQEFHASVRTHNLPASVAFYTALLGAPPKEWTHRYATFHRPDLQTNFVIVVNDGLALHHDTLYHLGVGLADRQAVIDAETLALQLHWPIHKPARTTWRGTPLHELWLKDPDGNLVEVYARLNPAEMSTMPTDQEPIFLTAYGQEHSHEPAQ